MLYFDENGNRITEENIEPDWSVWTSTRVEEKAIKKDDESHIEIRMYCRKYQDEELAVQNEEKRKQRITDQIPIALQLYVLQANLPDELAIQVEALYPDWEIGKDYIIGDIRRYSEGLYRALQNSTGAVEHTPNIATSLWKRIGEPDESGIFPWVQPLGATDAYMTGDKVTHNGKIYISKIDNNVWEPGTDESLWTEEV